LDDELASDGKALVFRVLVLRLSVQHLFKPQARRCHQGQHSLEVVGGHEYARSPPFNRFRSERLKENIKTLFSLKELYADGAIESIHYSPKSGEIDDQESKKRKPKKQKYSRKSWPDKVTRVLCAGAAIEF